MYTVTVATLFLLSPLLALPLHSVGNIGKSVARTFLCLILRIPCMATSSIVRLVQAFTQYLSLFRQTFLLCVCEQAVRGLLFIPIVNWILVNGNIPYQYLRLFSVTERVSSC